MISHSISLGINIDQVALLRQQRTFRYPDPVMAALTAEQAGAQCITLHLNEDQHPIQDRDLILLKGMCPVPIHLKMSTAESMLTLAEHLKPEFVCFAAEIKEDNSGLEPTLLEACHRLREQDINIILSVLPDLKEIEIVKEAGIKIIEVDTFSYTQAIDAASQAAELAKIKTAAKFAQAIGLQVGAAGGLHYHNVSSIAELLEINRITIGHAIMAKALFVGLDAAIKEMKVLIQKARTAA